MGGRHNPPGREAAPKWRSLEVPAAQGGARRNPGSRIIFSFLPSRTREGNKAVLSGLWEPKTNANPPAAAGASLHAGLRVLRAPRLFSEPQSGYIFVAPCVSAGLAVFLRARVPEGRHVILQSMQRKVFGKKLSSKPFFVDQQNQLLILPA